MFIYFSNKKISEIVDVSDTDAEPVPEYKITPPPTLRPPPPPVSIDMHAFYAEYLACLNTGGAVDGRLEGFCKPGGLMWNGAKMSVEQYGRMIQESREAIEGSEFVAATVLADEMKQTLAVRLEFEGTLVKAFGGAVPNGTRRAVSFSKIVFYWLEQGRISDVLTIVDWQTVRAQLGR